MANEKAGSKRQTNSCLQRYLRKCALYAFVNDNAYYRFEPVREELLLYHTHSIPIKCLKNGHICPV
jgi:hypothetical protein